MVFIDLGFVLLVGFLILTETAPRSNVALPGDVEQLPAPHAEMIVHNLHFTDGGRFWIEDGMRTFCDLNTVELLQACMWQIIQTRADAAFVLVPTGRATVQQMVVLLDLCGFNEWTCTVSN